jgi:hypothetical protein
MMPPVDYLEVKTTAFSRAGFRLGLQRLKRRGFAIEWLEHEGWWASVFMVRGHPLLISKLQRISGRTARRPPILHGRNLDIIV